MLVCLTNMIVAMIVYYCMHMCRSIMRMRDKMHMNMFMVANQCVRSYKYCARYHKNQAEQVHDCKLLSIHNECQKCSYKWRNRIKRTRLCRAQITLGPDIHKNAEAIRYKSKYHRQCHILDFR